MVLIVKDNMRLCNDGRFRQFANFGTFKECVKVYRSVSAATKKAKEVSGSAVSIPAGHTVDACGSVYDQDNKRVVITALC